MSDNPVYEQGIQINAPISPAYAEILTPEAVAFVARLQRAFGARLQALLQDRARRQAEFDAGTLPDFLPETEELRRSAWTVAPLPADLVERCVEITGPTDRKMVINALNSGANMFMADFEDANTPAWDNLLQGQINLRDAVRRTLTYTSPEGKAYALNHRVATLWVRPRGWHLLEKHMQVDGEPVAGGLFDFGLYFFHNARALLAQGSGPYFYLPKLESHREARLWNSIFMLAQQELGIPRGTIRATVLIETLPAAFEMEEILYELREHCAGLNTGRWDYLFSCIKKLRNRRGFTLADRGLLTMTTRFMRAYALLLVKTCHRRHAQAIGGMAAQIPIKDDPQANAVALAKVWEDKDREANDGFDGTWVAHPGLVATAREAFDRVMTTPNQLHRQRDDVQVAAADLLAFGPERPITLAGLKLNLDVGIRYLGAWLGGSGAVPIYNLMEDTATAEISRAQVWQWIHSPKGVLEDGRKVTVELVRDLLPEVMEGIRRQLSGDDRAGHYEQAAQLFERLTTSEEFVEFLTLPAYELID